MKIAYLLQAGAPDVRTTPRSGPAAHVAHVFEQLQALGHTLRLVAQYHDGIWVSDDLVDFRRVTVPRHDRGPLRWFERGVRRVQSELTLPYAALFESARYAAACRQAVAGFDILYERMGWMGFAGALAARQMGVPLVLEVNGDHLAEFEMLGAAPQGMQRAISLRETRWAARQAAGVVATGEGWRQKFIDRWGVAPARVKVVENGSEVVELLGRAELRAFQPPAPPGAPVRMVFLGAFDPWHGLPVLLQALAQARSRGADVVLDLIGDGKERETITGLIRELKLEAAVTLAGFLRAAQFAPRLAQAEIGLSPYCGRVEYSGLKLLDYKAAGLATIASGADGQPFVLRHGETGWIVPPCDVGALAEALCRLAGDAELRRQFGRAARLEAEQLHSWRHTAEEVACFLQEVLAQQRGTHGR